MSLSNTQGTVLQLHLGSRPSITVSNTSAQAMVNSYIKTFCSCGLLLIDTDCIKRLEGRRGVVKFNLNAGVFHFLFSSFDPLRLH